MPKVPHAHYCDSCGSVITEDAYWCPDAVPHYAGPCADCAARYRKSFGPPLTYVNRETRRERPDPHLP